MDNYYYNAEGAQQRDEKYDDDDDEDYKEEEEDDDDFPETFAEAQPGFFPLMLRSLAGAVQQVPVFRPLLREKKFKDLLRREADFRSVVIML